VEALSSLYAVLFLGLVCITFIRVLNVASMLYHMCSKKNKQCRTLRSVLAASMEGASFLPWACVPEHNKVGQLPDDKDALNRDCYRFVDGCV